MSLAGHLIGFGLRQVIGIVVGDDAAEAAGTFAGPVIQVVERHFRDHSQTLPKALGRANNRAWQALSIALAGDRFLDKLKVFFASAADKGIREQVRLFLEDKSIDFGGTSPEVRKNCLTELQQAKKAGLLTARNLSPSEVARQTANFKRYSDPKALMDGAELVVRRIADDLASEYPNLANLLRQRPAGGQPLLVSAFAYFFRREVESDDELAHGLLFDGLRQLSTSQAKAFGEVNKALNSLGDQFEQVFEHLDRIEGVVFETHGVVLDLQVEMQRLASANLSNFAEVHRLMLEVLNLVNHIGMQKGEIKPHHGFSIRNEDELNAVKQLLARFREMPVEQHRHFPALLNGIGKLQIGAGDFQGARQTFLSVADEVYDLKSKAEANFNAYLAAVEEKKWDDALAASLKAARQDAQRFALFPLRRYEVKQILGAGAFGTAFHCLDRFQKTEVVIKAFHDVKLDRSFDDVFREAHILGALQHPAIIGVKDANYADSAQTARPYIVMEYFPGISLAAYLEGGKVLPLEDALTIAYQIAEGMLAAHQREVWHRDIKPDNILVLRNSLRWKDGGGVFVPAIEWKVKIIDFGLALRGGNLEKSAGKSTLNDSVAGTLKYAPPETSGEWKGVRPGPHSDVFSFGKMMCEALFETTEPKRYHWAKIPQELAEMLESCTERKPDKRLPGFEPVLKVLEDLRQKSGQRDTCNNFETTSKRPDTTARSFCIHCGHLRSPFDRDTCSQCKQILPDTGGVTGYDAECGHFVPGNAAFCPVCGKSAARSFCIFCGCLRSTFDGHTCLRCKQIIPDVTGVTGYDAECGHFVPGTACFCPICGKNIVIELTPANVEEVETECATIIKRFIRGTDPDKAYIDRFATEHGITTQRIKEITRQEERAWQVEQGESALVASIRDALNRANGRLRKVDAAAAKKICKDYGLEIERANRLVAEVKEQWRKAHPSRA